MGYKDQLLKNPKAKRFTQGRVNEHNIGCCSLTPETSYDLLSMAPAEPLTHSLFTLLQYMVPTSLCLTPVGSSRY